MKKNIVPGFDSIFIYRAVGQNSLQATVERPPSRKPLVIPRSGTSAPIGMQTLINRILPPEK